MLRVGRQITMDLLAAGKLRVVPGHGKIREGVTIARALRPQPDIAVARIPDSADRRRFFEDGDVVAALQQNTYGNEAAQPGADNTNTQRLSAPQLFRLAPKTLALVTNYCRRRIA